MRFASYSALLLIAALLTACWSIYSYHGMNLLSSQVPISYSCHHHRLNPTTNLSSFLSAKSPSLYQKPLAINGYYLYNTCPTSDICHDRHFGTSRSHDLNNLAKFKVNKLLITDLANFQTKDKNSGHNLTKAETFKNSLRPINQHPYFTIMSAFSYFSSPPPDDRSTNDHEKKSTSSTKTTSKPTGRKMDQISPSTLSLTMNLRRSKIFSVASTENNKTN